MIQTNAARRPSIHMIDCEADALTNLALSVEDDLPDVSTLLLNEISRAKIYTAARIPEDVAVMMSTVTFDDEGSGTERSVQLAYPRHADIAAGRISILTLIGAGLIGLRTGQAIVWPDRGGHERVLRIKDVQRY